MQATTVQVSVNANVSNAAVQKEYPGVKTEKGEFKSLLGGLLKEDLEIKEDADKTILAILAGLLQQSGVLDGTQLKELPNIDGLQNLPGDLLLLLKDHKADDFASQILPLVVKELGLGKNQIEGLQAMLQTLEMPEITGEKLDKEFKLLLEKILSQSRSDVPLNENMKNVSQEKLVEEKLQQEPERLAAKVSGLQKNVFSASGEINRGASFHSLQPKQQDTHPQVQPYQVQSNQSQQQNLLLKNMDAASNVSFDNLYEQLAAKVKLTSYQGKNEALIQLKPESLGKLQLKLTLLKEGVMLARFVVENHQVAQALQQQMPQLRQELQGQGLELQQVSVEIGGDASQHHSFGEQLQQQSRERKSTQGMKVSDVELEELQISKHSGVDLLA